MIVNGQIEIKFCGVASPAIAVNNSTFAASGCNK